MSTKSTGLGGFFSCIKNSPPNELELNRVCIDPREYTYSQSDRANSANYFLVGELRTPPLSVDETRGARDDQVTQTNLDVLFDHDVPHRISD